MLTKLFVNAQLAFENFKKDERGVTAIEYAIIAVAISGVVFTVFKDSGPLKAALDAAMTKITSNITNVSK
ncbi:putative Flp/Fap pilin component [Vibrio nigripulchritudo MADA3029]|uniref:Putative Flp/Fap pilin component n=1 Tax=Vibrio nigripulchritudo TaxID=28173 RepID=U4KGK9_9VIBR|nr:MULTISPECIES: Flp family type IVb pilin [Vibrio]UAB73845.1 Flp family type IVb pilin [Vibrio sp. SCSIO 43132]CCN45594.1 putative Flp/Fap pilin component [Vibrio nigripulchritudo MADA3020]CCN55847.1 putative Flp/Fap pilin component [Vibrio nigripulchritudo MADA3021]CCN57071.1 putative Flp/Fap pilin component [Vibrio nigripulchritudo MADA3029]CCN80892.1 putative Flp/Fap pilin component [Vibrio nigripulchritudo BLFn1]